MTITTTAPIIDANGIHAPTYAEILDYLKSQYRSIYGPDAYLEADSQDGQLLAAFSSSINDANAAAVNAYNSFSPATAQGNALSSNVKINGLKRNSFGYSTVDVLIVGVGGTPITNGIVKDANKNQWALPASVTIPPGGSITVTATCKAAGAITAAANTVNQIGTPTLGWQTVNNGSSATPGAPVESDAALRKRQSTSTSLPSRTVLEGIVGAVAAVPGVVRYAPYENDTGSTDANGLPAHSISLVVDGGDATAIANAIASKKGPGSGTFGTTTVTVTDAYGIPHPINFYRPVDAPIGAAITIKQLTGYTSSVGTAIQQAVSDYINSVQIGGGIAKCVEWDSAITAAKSVPGNNTFKIVSLTLTGPHAGSPDAPLLFNEGATCSPSSVALTVT